jgi:hypothetical protein
MAGLGDSARIRDFAKAAIVNKTVHLTEDERAVLTRLRSQVPPQWYALAGNPEEAKDGLWAERLAAGIWLKVVYEDGRVVVGQISASGDGHLISLDGHTTLVNDGAVSAADYQLATDAPEVQQAFTNNQEIAHRVKKERHKIRFPD